MRRGFLPKRYLSGPQKLITVKQSPTLKFRFFMLELCKSSGQHYSISYLFLTRTKIIENVLKSAEKC